MKNTMHITLLGGGREIGRNSILADSGKNRFLLDFGLDVQESRIPLMPGPGIKSVFISHAHLDHVGAVPALFNGGYRGSVVCTPATHGLSALLLYDSMKVQGITHSKAFYTEDSIEMMLRSWRPVKLDEKLEFGIDAVSFHNAGHVPGSVTTLIESNGESLLYTGDIKFSDTHLMRAAYTDFNGVKTVVCESTYMYKNHPDRPGLEKELKQSVMEAIENNGTVLLPCFSVGRTQEMLLIVSELDVPLYMDGMGIDATKIILSHPNSVRDINRLQNAFDRAIKVNRPRKRKEALVNPSVIIATAGMLNGGRIHHYIRRLYARENCRLILTGYQAEDTVGRRLLDTGHYIHDGIDKKMQMEVKYMDFSAHCDRDSITGFLKKISPEKIILMHSDRTEEYSRELSAMGFDTLAPKNGEMIQS